MTDRIDGWSATVEVNGDDILTIAHDCLGGHPDLVDKFAPYVRACAANLLSFIGAGPDHIGCHIALESPPAQPAWISVKDRLPNEGQAVMFVVASKHPDYDGRVLGGSFCMIGRTPSFNTPGVGYEASHWMPLPAAPVSSVASKEDD